jgi:hypothetical protein
VYSHSGSSPNRSREEIRFSDYRSSVIAVQERKSNTRPYRKKTEKGITILNVNVCRELKKRGRSKTGGK